MKYENDSCAHSTDRVEETLTLPVFDSLPASAGLDNAEAFRLSLKHALALLPRVLAARDAAAVAETVERFALR